MAIFNHEIIEKNDTVNFRRNHLSTFNLLPTTHAAEAMRRVLVLGEGVDAIGYEVGAIIVLSIGILVVGMALYQRMQLRTGKTRYV